MSWLDKSCLQLVVRRKDKPETLTFQVSHDPPLLSCLFFVSLLCRCSAKHAHYTDIFYPAAANASKYLLTAPLIALSLSSGSCA